MNSSRGGEVQISASTKNVSKIQQPNYTPVHWTCQHNTFCFHKLTKKSPPACCPAPVLRCSGGNIFICFVMGRVQVGDHMWSKEWNTVRSTNRMRSKEWDSARSANQLGAKNLILPGAPIMCGTKNGMLPGAPIICGAKNGIRPGALIICGAINGILSGALITCGAKEWNSVRSTDHM